MTKVPLMNRVYKFLVFTDHRGHSAENSIYALIRKLSKHQQCERVDIVSRGNPANDDFFYHHKTTAVYAMETGINFQFDETGKQFTTTNNLVDVNDYDVIIMRLPRPIETDFFKFLSTVGTEKIIINHPKGIENTSTKAFLLAFPAICPPMRLCYSVEDILNFSKQFSIVLKPLKEYGGKGILKIDGTRLHDGDNEFETVAYLQNLKSYIEAEGFLAMQFMKNVSEGDKRILVVNGKILASSLRLPAKGSWLCNVARGGHSVTAEVTPEEEEIVKTISPRLLKEGILIFGADTLVDDSGKRVLSEINTLSIGGFPQAEQQTGKPILQQTINGIIDFINASLIE